MLSFNYCYIDPPKDSYFSALEDSDTSSEIIEEVRLLYINTCMFSKSKRKLRLFNYIAIWIVHFVLILFVALCLPNIKNDV